MISRKRLLLHKGRSGGDTKPFAMLPDEMLKSDAGRTLPHPARSVLTVLAAQYGGKNNGSLSLTRKTASEYGIGNPHTLGAALRELETRGLIIRTRLGTRIPPRSALFAVTWRQIDTARPSDPHDVAPTIRAPDTWRNWITETQRQHWTDVGRRAARYRRDTRSSSAGIHGTAQMGSAGIQDTPLLPVAHPYRSDISGVGRRGKAFGKYPAVGAMRVFHLPHCKAGSDRRLAFAEPC